MTPFLIFTGYILIMIFTATVMVYLKRKWELKMDDADLRILIFLFAFIAVMAFLGALGW